VDLRVDRLVGRWEDLRADLRADRLVGRWEDLRADRLVGRWGDLKVDRWGDRLVGPKVAVRMGVRMRVREERGVGLGPSQEWVGPRVRGRSRASMAREEDRPLRVRALVQKRVAA
jgi:hypothetical protein